MLHSAYFCQASMFYPMAFLTVSNITKSIEGAPILNGVSFSLASGKKLAIMGETGSGKSSLMKIAAGLMQADEGSVHLDGHKVPGPLEVLIPGNKHVAYLSQHFELLKNYKVSDLLEMSNKMNDPKAAQIYRVCDIAHLLRRKTNQLSGGERQRIALAKLLITQPRLLILDEPFTNLDLVHKKAIHNVIQKISDELRLTCILVSHDPQDLLPWADEIMVMKDGIVVQHDSPEQVYDHPVNTYVAGLLGEYNLLEETDAALLEKLGTGGMTPPLLIRPETLRITSDLSQGATAEVLSKKWMGHYFQLEAAAGKTRLLLYSDTCSAVAGETIRIHYQPRPKP